MKKLTFTMLSFLVTYFSNAQELSNILPFSENASKLTENYEHPTMNGLMSIVDCWGDSLTAGARGGGTTYPSVLQTLLGENYLVSNYGVGGEDVPTISARQGGVTAIITEEFTLPADLSTVEISSKANVRLKNSFRDKAVQPLIQGSAGVNPCFVQGVECILSYNKGTTTWFLRRNVAGDSKVIKPKSEIIFNGSKKTILSDISIFWIGQNGGYDNIDSDLVLYIKKCIENLKNKKYLILGITTSSRVYRANLEKLMLDEFSHKYINLREYLSTYGLEDAGLTPTAEDLTQMANGAVPPQILSDTVHFNATGYTLIANKIYQRMQELNFLN